MPVNSEITTPPIRAGEIPLRADMPEQAATQALPVNTTARWFCLTSAFWMMVATFYGLLGATG
jgi:hypothetical protein